MEAPSSHDIEQLTQGLKDEEERAELRVDETPSVSDEAAQHLEQAFALEDKDKYEKALEECERAIRLDPSLADAHNLRGAILEELGREGEAVLAYREALRLDPGFDAARENLQAVEAELRAEKMGDSPAVQEKGTQRTLGASPRWKWILAGFLATFFAYQVGVHAVIILFQPSRFSQLLDTGYYFAYNCYCLPVWAVGLLALWAIVRRFSARKEGETWIKIAVVTCSILSLGLGCVAAMGMLGEVMR